MPITTSTYTLTDINGSPLYTGAEGNSASPSTPGVPRSAPFHYDCDTARIAGTASADLVAAISGKRIRVVSLSLSANAACNLTIQSGGATNLYGPIYLEANSSHSLALDTGIFEGALGEKLNAVLSGAATYSISLRYREIG